MTCKSLFLISLSFLDKFDVCSKDLSILVHVSHVNLFYHFKGFFAAEDGK